MLLKLQIGMFVITHCFVFLKPWTGIALVYYCY